VKTPLLVAILIVGLALVAIGLYSISQPTKQTSSTELEVGTVEPKTPAGYREVARGTINVKNQFTEIGSYKGKILIQVWGKATIDSTQEPFTPRGWIGKRALNKFPLPNGPLFGAILKADEQILFVGDSNEFDFPQTTALSLGPNDETDLQNGLGFTDNKGTWKYKVSTPNR
jgi:hypothetical protein